MAIAAARPTLVARTKSDLSPPPAGEIGVSAVTGEGLGDLRRAAAERVFGDLITFADLEPGLTRERHRVALTRAREALGEALPHLAPGGDAVLAAHHVREATTALDELLGAVDVEEVLGRIFGSFCVGK
jgi:tRNA modification GTPase